MSHLLKGGGGLDLYPAECDRTAVQMAAGMNHVQAVPTAVGMAVSLRTAVRKCNVSNGGWGRVWSCKTYCNKNV